MDAKPTNSTRPMTIGGNAVTHFVRIARNIHEARVSLPELTQAQYAAIRAGTARITGDSSIGLQYEEDA